MGFRDDSEALRARVDVLERELAEARAKLDDLEGAGVERDRLRDRVAELERKLGERRSKQLAQFSWVPGLLAAIGIGVGAIALVSRCDGAAPDLAAMVSSEILSPTAAPSIGMIDLDATPDPAPVRGRATGETGAPPECRGEYPAAPQLVLRTTHPAATRVAPVADSGDLVLALRLPDGRVLCDDDSGGSLNPLLSVVLPPGDTRVWVGSYSGDSLDFRLQIHARAEDVLPGRGAPTLGSVEGPGGSGFFQGMLETFEPASQENAACRGFLPSQEQAVIHLRERSAVRIDARGDHDLVLLVREPDGSVKCDDDSGPGNAPRIATIFMPGDHHVLVGSYSQQEAPIAFSLDVVTYAIDPDAAPTAGTRALAPGGDGLRVDGRTSGELAPSAIGADCTGGLIGAAPQVAIELAQPQEVLLGIASASTPFVVVQHPDRSFECVREAHVRSGWGAGTHRIYAGVADEQDASELTLTVRAEASSLRPWTP